MSMPAPLQFHATDGWMGGWAGSAPANEDAVALELDDGGVILDCEGASERLLGYRPSELVSQHVSLILPQLAGVELRQQGQLNSRLRFLCSVAGYLRATARNGEKLASDVFINELGTAASPRLRMIVRRQEAA